MTATTALYALPYAVATDHPRDFPSHMQALAERVDLMLGEGGSQTVTPDAVDTTKSVAVSYGRTYPTIPRVLLTHKSNAPTSVVVNFWVSNETTTGFTLNVRAGNTSARAFNWQARP